MHVAHRVTLIALVSAATAVLGCGDDTTGETTTADVGGGGDTLTDATEEPTDDAGGDPDAVEETGGALRPAAL